MLMQLIIAGAHQYCMHDVACMMSVYLLLFHKPCMGAKITYIGQCLIGKAALNEYLAFSQFLCRQQHYNIIVKP